LETELAELDTSRCCGLVDAVVVEGERDEDVILFQRHQLDVAAASPASLPQRLRKTTMASPAPALPPSGGIRERVDALCARLKSQPQRW